MNTIIGTFVLFSALFHGLAVLLLASATNITPQNSKQLSQQPQGLQAIIVSKSSDVHVSARPVTLTKPDAQVAKDANFDSPVLQSGALEKLGAPDSNERNPEAAPAQNAKQSAISRINSELLPLTPTAVTPYFFTANEVDYRAEMLLPMEMTWFDEEFALSGSLKMNIYVLADGTVDKIDLISTADVSGALREKLLPLLQMAKYSPAVKNGKAVNSIKTMEFDLAARADPKLTTEATLAGFRPKLDDKGNIAPNQDLTLWPRDVLKKP